MFSDVITQLDAPESMFDAEIHAEWIWHGEIKPSDVCNLSEDEISAVAMEIKIRYGAHDLAAEVMGYQSKGR